MWFPARDVRVRLQVSPLTCTTGAERPRVFDHGLYVETTLGSVGVPERLEGRGQRGFRASTRDLEGIDGLQGWPVSSFVTGP